MQSLLLALYRSRFLSLLYRLPLLPKGSSTVVDICHLVFGVATALLAGLRMAIRCRSQ